METGHLNAGISVGTSGKESRIGVFSGGREGDGGKDRQREKKKEREKEKEQDDKKKEERRINELALASRHWSRLFYYGPGKRMSTSVTYVRPSVRLFEKR